MEKWTNRALMNPRASVRLFALSPFFLRGERWFLKKGTETSMMARNEAQWVLSKTFRRTFSFSAEKSENERKKRFNLLLSVSAFGFAFAFASQFTTAEGFSIDSILNTEGARLRRRLDYHKLKVKKVSGDGNCQFRAVADQLFDDQNHYKIIRQQVVGWLLKNGNLPIDGEGTRLRDFQIDFRNWEEYCRYMSKDGVWGDHFTLIAIAETFHVNIWILTSLDCPDDQAVTLVTPRTTKATKTIYILHAHQNHYDSLRKVT